MKTKKKGFTIVELVIVIAVIAILAAVLIPTFSGIIKKANESTDTQLVRNLNMALVSDNKEHKTMQSALDAAKEFGFDVDKINTKVNENEILWDSVNDCFVYKTDSGIEYIPNSKKTEESVKNYQFWRIANDLSDQTYSIYAGKGWTATTVGTVDNPLTVGFDAGEFTRITSINYVGVVTPQNVVIRTNGGTLTVNAPSDIVKHYGYAEVLDVQAVDFSTSYHEYGASGFARVAKGHFVVEGTGTVNVLYATGTKTGDTAVKVDNNNGIIGKAFATDESVANEENNAPKQDGNIVLVKDDSVTSDIITAVTAGNIAETLATNDALKGIVANSAFRGEGTEESPYLISNANELKLYQEKVNQGLYCASTVYFKLTNDVDISIYEWTPIGVETSAVDKQYNGHFDGNNKTISGLTMSTGTARIGLFGIVYAPTIENVKLSGVSINGEKRIGALVGQIKGNAIITNCAVDSKSKIVGSDANVGGLIGEAINGTEIKLSNLINEAEVIAEGKDDGRAAGIIAQVTTGAGVTITNCINNGKISAMYAGGMVSALQSGKITIENCANNADISDFTGNYKANLCAWLTGDVSIVIKNKTTSRDDLCVLNITYGTVTINGVIYVQSSLFVADWKTTSCQELSKDKLDLILDFYCWVRDRNYISLNNYYQGDYSYLIKNFGSIAGSWNKTSQSVPDYLDAEKEYCTEKGITYNAELFEKTWTTGILYEIK